MKKIISGGILILCGVILYLGIHIPAVHYATEIGSWTTPPGRLGTALNEMGVTKASNNSVFMIIGGLIILLWGCFEDEIGVMFKKLKSDPNSSNATKNDVN